VRVLEIDAELNDVMIEIESINSTLDTLEEHHRYVSEKLRQITE